VMWITSSTISKWHRLNTFTTNRSIMTKESNVVGLTDGSPGFTHAKITGRSAPKRPCTAWTLANSGLRSPIGPEVAAYERHTPVGLITRGWGSGDRTRPKNSTRNNVEQTWLPLPGGVVNSARISLLLKLETHLFQNYRGLR